MDYKNELKGLWTYFYVHLKIVSYFDNYENIISYLFKFITTMFHFKNFSHRLSFLHLVFYTQILFWTKLIMLNNLMAHFLG